MSQRFKQFYTEQLIKAGVPPLKAQRAAGNLSVEELTFIGEIWPDWAMVLAQLNCQLKS